ncbi:MAG: sigma-70 family RNA polymerase sigma factor [Candidatus Promineifilaceae bacterium]
MEEENDLLKRAQALDEEALAEIHDRYYQGVYRYFSFRMPDPQTAEDLTSEVFLRFLKAIRDKHAPPNTIQGWLFGAARNVAREYYRHSKKTELVPLTDHIPAGGNSPEQTLSKRLDIQALAAAVAQLTDDQKHVLALRFGYGMPIREVAGLINKSEAAVKMLQARAIMALTRQMDPQT